MNASLASKILIESSIYVLEGSLLVVCNTVLVTAVLNFEALRELKEFLILAALSLADALSGFGTLCAGLYRIPLTLSGQMDHPASRRDCFFTPHIIFWTLSAPLSSFMLVAVSIDRLLCVIAPMKYLEFGNTYTYTILTSIYGYCIAQFVIFALRAWPETQAIGIRFCSTNGAFDPFDLTFWWYGMTLASLLSIVIYVAVIVVYRKRKARVQVFDASKEASLARQRRLTRTLGVSCVCTFTFHALPTMFGIAALWIPELDYKDVATWCAMLMNIHPICNLGIYFRKQKEIHIAIVALFKGKEMPPNVEMWN